MRDTETLIIKKDKSGLVAFYVVGRANYGMIMSMTFEEGHSEASLEYYHKTKNPTKLEADRFIKRYRSHYDCDVVQRFKLSHNDLLKIWGMK